MKLIQKIKGFPSLAALVLAGLVVGAGANAAKTAYERLGLSPAASDEEIGQAYRAMRGEDDLWRVLSRPLEWRRRVRAYLAYRRIGSTSARDRYDEWLHRYDDLAPPPEAEGGDDFENQLRREKRNQFMPLFVSGPQLEALVRATYTIGEKDVVWHLEDLVNFKLANQTRALDIASKAMKVEVKDYLKQMLAFQNDDQIEALKVVASSAPARLHLRLQSIARITSQEQVDALSVLAPALGPNLDHVLGRVAELRNEFQVAALEVAVPHLGANIEFELGKLKGIDTLLKVQALHVVAFYLGPQLINHLHSLAKITNQYQYDALENAGRHYGRNLDRVIPEILQIQTRRAVDIFRAHAEIAGRSPEDAVRSTVKSCAAEFK